MSELRRSEYIPSEIEYLEQGFTHGFDIGYRGPQKRQSSAKNLPLRVGSQTELWNKLIKEVKVKRVAGPFNSIPFDNYIQKQEIQNYIQKQEIQNRLD